MNAGATPKVEYNERVIRLADLFTSANAVGNARFTNCFLVGPAIILPLNDCLIQRSAFDGDPNEVFWPIGPDRPSVIGALPFVDCEFVECRFTRVGFAGSEETRRQFIVGLGGTP